MINYNNTYNTIIEFLVHKYHYKFGHTPLNDISKEEIQILVNSYIDETKVIHELYYVYNNHPNRLRHYNQVNLAVPLKVLYRVAIDNNLFDEETFNKLLNDLTMKKYGVNLKYEDVLPDKRFTSYELELCEKQEHFYDNILHSYIVSKMVNNISSSILNQIDSDFENLFYKLLHKSTNEEIIYMITSFANKYPDFNLVDKISKLSIFKGKYDE